MGTAPSGRVGGDAPAKSGAMTAEEWAAVKAEQALVAQGDAIIWTDNDNNDSKITV